MLRGLFAFLFFLIFTPAIATAAVLDHAFRRRCEIDLAWPRIWGRGMLAAAGGRLTARGQSRLPDGGPCLYAANHASNADIWAVLQLLPAQTKFVAKRELFLLPFFGWVMRRAGFVSIDRSDRTGAIRSLDEAAQRIRGGCPVIVFAEGKRSLDGTLQPFKKGPFHLALKAGVPIVPVAIRGSFALLPPGAWRARPGPVEVHFLPPIDPRDFSTTDPRPLLEAVRERIAAALATAEPLETRDARRPSP